MAVQPKQGLSQKDKKLIVLVIALLLIQFYSVAAFSVSASSNTGSPTYATKLWRFSTDGSVYHPPVVSEGYVCVVSSFVTYNRASLYCLNASTGVQIWKYTTPKGYFTMPIITNGVVYTRSYPSIIYAFNASTGAIIWSRNGSISTIDNGVLYGDSSSYEGIQALDSSTGETIWEYTTEYLGPVAVVNGYAYGNSRSGLVYAIDAASGAKKWSYNITYRFNSLLVAGNHVYVRCNNRDIYGNVISSGIFALSASTGEQVWRYITNGDVISPVVSNELVYVGSGDGNVNALNVSSGEKIWNYTTDGSPSSLVLSDQHLYTSVNSEHRNASLYCFDATTEAKIWNYTTEPGNAASSPVVVDGQVYVGNTGPQFFAHRDHYVYALNASTGEQIWNYTIEGNAGSLTVADGVVYVSAPFTSKRSATSEGNGAVYALKPTTITLPPLTIIAVVMVAVVVTLSAVLLLIYKMKRR